MDGHDAVVVGSGPNGLAAAVHLARQGWKVLVLESGATPGGGTRTQELTLPGFRHDVCSAVHPMALASPFFRELELEKHGLRWLQPEIPLAHPLDGGRVALLHRDLERTAEGLGKDAGRYRMLFGPIVRRMEDLWGDALAPLHVPRHPLTLARFGIGAGLPATWLARWFSTDEARALFAGNAAHGVMPLNKLLTSAVGLMLQSCAHAVGWPVPEGGSQRIADVLVGMLRERGGELRCGVTVKSLRDLPPARAWLFDVSPRNLAAIAGDELSPKYCEQLQRYRHGPGVFKVDYALSAPIPWRSSECGKAGTVHVGGRLENIAAAEAAAWYSTKNDDPFVLVSQPTAVDPARAPKGRHIAWAYCHVSSGSTEDKLEVINRQIERFAPGFRDCILATHVMDCARMEAYNANYVGGDVIGGVTDWRQLFTRPVVRWNPYSTPNPKIFLCSASTPPGGGVHGMCGYWAAETVRKRIRLG